MNQTMIDLLVIGAGPAGLRAATTAASLGVDTLLLDMYDSAGGQYFNRPAPGFSVSNVGPELKVGTGLFEAARRAGCRLEPASEVWGIYGDRPFQVGVTGGSSECLVAKSIVIATGAYDRPIPFPGWTLPGVVTAGGAMSLLKNQRVLAGRRFLLSGSGPLQLAIGARLASAGARIEAILELRGRAALLGGLRRLGTILSHPSRLGEGRQYLEYLIGQGVPIRFGRGVTRVEGEDGVERAVISRVDGDGCPVSGTESYVEVDTVCLGYGFVPAMELSRQAGCEHAFSDRSQTLVPVCDSWLETSVPGIFVAGDSGGVTGKDAALLEGHLAGLGVAKRLGRVTPEKALSEAVPLRKSLDRELRFSSMLDDLFGPLPGLWDLADDDTIVCRCEEVRLREVKEAIACGADSFAAVKAQTRASMGRCQGRMCADTVARVIARELGIGLDEASRRSIRPPVLPVSLEDALKSGSETESE